MKIAVVVVTYHPDRALYERMRFAAAESDLLVLVDNGSSAAELAQTGCPETSGIRWICNARNLGVAAALNQGIDLAFIDADVVLLLDQDSELRSGWRAQVEAAFGHGKAEPALFSLDQPTPFDGLDEVPTCITAGSFLSKTTWQKTGSFVEALFIDYVDHEYGLRIRRLGGSVWRINGADSLIHEIGIPTRARLGVRHVELMNSSPFRWFHIGRNLVWLWKGPAWTDRAWARAETWAVLKRLMKCALFETDRLNKLGQAAKGVLWGLVKKSPIL